MPNRNFVIEQLATVDRLRWVAKHFEGLEKLELDATLIPANETTAKRSYYSLTVRGPKGQVERFEWFVRGWFDGFKHAKGL